MVRLFLSLLLTYFALSVIGQEPLPKGMTNAEKEIWDEYLRNYPIDRGTEPPAEIPRTPAEWEEMQGVVVTWADYASNLREIVRHAKEEVTVYIICSNPTTVENYLSQGGVDTENVEFVVAPFNSVWVRDYGPQSIYLSGTNELAFVDWIYNRPRPDDDVIPSVMADYLDVPIFQMIQEPNNLIATGGNFMTDGFDQGFSSKLILEENSSLNEAQIDNIKLNYMGIEPYIKMETLPYDGIHHIDMHMKLLDEETLLVGQYPEGVSDGPQIEANLNYVLNNYQTPYGRPYKVVRIPMPSNQWGNYPPNSYYLTYTNSVILNGLVLVPIYGRPEDEEALDIYREAMPGYNVVGINMLNVISASGAIHCITREVAANDPIFIEHAPIRDEIEHSPSGYQIEANISSASGIQDASLYWSVDTTAGYNKVPLTYENSTYSAVIPNSPDHTKFYYYLSSTNGNSKTITKPLVAPEGLYVFNVSSPNYLLTLNTEGNGSVLVDGIPYENPVEADEGEELVLDAIASVGYHFHSWSGDLESTNDDEIVTMVSDLYITANFSINTYLIQYSSDEGGYINGETNQTVAHGSSSTQVEAIPNEGYHFTKWSDDLLSPTRTEENVTENISVSAQFDLNAYTLTYTAGSNGEISGPTEQIVLHGDDGAEVTAVPNEGYHFVRWSDDITDNPRKDFNVTQDINVEAIFSLNIYTLTMVVDGDGNTSPSPGEYNYIHGTSVSLNAYPSLGYDFEKWECGEDDIFSRFTEITITNDIVVNAIFKETSENQFILSIVKEGTGTTSPPVGNHVYNENTNVNLLAIPGSIWKFEGWSGDLVSDQPEETIIINSHKSVKASFELQSFTLTYNYGDGGSINGEQNQIVNYGENGTAVSAIPDEGFHFVRWSDNLQTATRIDMNVTSDITVDAEFAVNSYTLTYGSGPGGYIEGDSIQTVTFGSDGIAVTAKPNTGYYFIKWTDGVTTPVRTDTNITSNINVYAEFAINRYNLSYTSDIGGFLQGDTAQIVSHGFDGTAVTAVPNSGYHFAGWSDNILATTRIDQNVTEDIAVSAFFDTTFFSLEIIIVGSGTVNVDEHTYTETLVFQEGKNVEIEAIAHNDCQFDGWSGDLLSSESIEYIIMDDHKSITATFSEIPSPTYTVTLNISPDHIEDQTTGSGNYFVGDTVFISTNPVDSFTFVAWRGNPEDVILLNDSTSLLTSFIMPDRDVAFTATYQKADDPQLYEVTFNLDLNVPEQIFNPENDSLFITGSFLGWSMPGTDPDNQLMSRIEETNIWTKTLYLEAGYYEYKYFINHGWSGGEWPGDPNRAINVLDNMVVDDVWYSCPDVEITFIVTDNNQLPVDEAIIAIDDGSEADEIVIETDEEGIATVSLPCCFKYYFTVIADNFQNYSDEFYSSEGETIEIVLTPVNAEFYFLTDIKVYPNPFSNFVTIETTRGLKSASIINILGKKLITIPLEGQNEKIINVSTLPNGVYLFEFYSLSGVKTVKKVIKQ